jgi:hypothetical protein
VHRFQNCFQNFFWGSRDEVTETLFPATDALQNSVEAAPSHTPQPHTPKPHTQCLSVFIISDSSGQTAAHVAHAAVTQFPPGVSVIKRCPQVRSRAQLGELVEEASKEPNALIAYTLVLPEYRSALESAAAARGIPRVDLLGPLLRQVSKLTGADPLAQPGRSHLLDEAYFSRMEAVNFAVQHDDGVNSERLVSADVVLVGLSRASKTPNCLYLAQHYGLKAANVPIVLGIAPPEALVALDRSKIVALHIDPHVLHSLRQSRALSMGVARTSQYASLEHIEEEVAYARKIFRQLSCYVIDVSTRAIEETSSDISLFLSRTIKGYSR